MKSNGRVAMLMSGGVDSSVSAALLKDRGYEVLGFYILGWLGTPEFPCPWQKEEKDARAVAEVLGIPFHTVNLSKVYEEEVIDRFFAGYQAGVTPNPDTLCNREIKFKALWQAIRQFECDYIATGHYARLKREFLISNSKFLMNDSMNQVPNIENSDIEDSLKIENSKLKIYSHPAIFKPADKEKDQTYFLWGIEKSILPKIIFPLGDLTKPEVRSLAKKFRLPTATKKDSQGICFVGPLKIRQFLSSRVKTKPGKVYLTDGRPVAIHEGVEYYTIGQRLAAGSVDWIGDVPPLFVIGKDIKRNSLIVGADAETFASELLAGSLNWFTPGPLEELSGVGGQTFEALAKIRYRQEDVSISAKIVGDKLSVKFTHPVRAITAGQSIVCYDSNGRLLGGGIIERVAKQDEILKRSAQNQSSAKV